MPRQRISQEEYDQMNPIEQCRYDKAYNRKKKYYDAHKEEIKEKMKVYNKAYKEKHREELNKKAREKHYRKNCAEVALLIEIQNQKEKELNK